MLDAVLPHAGTDDTLPSLNAVQFEVTAGTFYVVATDRYTIGCARYVIPGDPPEDARALLTLDEARDMRRVLGPAEDVVAALAFGKGLRMDAGRAGHMGAWAGLEAGKWKYPEWRSVLGGMLAESDAPFTLAAGLDPQYLMRLAPLDDPAWEGRTLVDTDGEVWEAGRRCEEPLMVRAVSINPGLGGASSLLLARGDWFLGALMFVRNDGKQRVDGVWESWSAALSPQPVPAGAA
jgi:hypothetical protein